MVAAMKYETVETIDGKTVMLVAPETPEDIEELKRRAEAGELDVDLSFGDLRADRSRNRRRCRRHRRR